MDPDKKEIRSSMAHKLVPKTPFEQQLIRLVQHDGSSALYILLLIVCMCWYYGMVALLLFLIQAFLHSRKRTIDGLILMKQSPCWVYSKDLGRGVER